MAEAQETSPCPTHPPWVSGAFGFVTFRRVQFTSTRPRTVTYKKLFLVFPPPWYYVTVNLADVGCRFLDGKPYFHGYLCFIKTIAVGARGK